MTRQNWRQPAALWNGSQCSVDMMKEARLYEKLPDGRVHCNLCAHRCLIDDGKRGICQVRENRGGALYTLVYGRIIAHHVDPVEKKPLFHFYPRSLAYSIATPGCNLRCRWCQNWEISQVMREQHIVLGQRASPKQIVAAAKRAGCRSIAYTYTEPTVFFEYAYDTARLAHDAGMANVYVTAGYMTEEMLETSRPYLDAVNVDLKGFRDETYRKYVGARLGPVLDAMKVMKRPGLWLEVTTLVIPGVSDDDEELKDAASFIVGELGPDTPWHISRFFPAYKMTGLPPTPLETLRRAWEIGKEAGLHYVYVGNVMDADRESTFCPECGQLLIQRRGYDVREVWPERGVCPRCDHVIPGVWEQEEEREERREEG